MTLAIEPMRRMDRPSGSTLLPGRVSPKPSTTDSSPRTTASTRPGAPELSHVTAPLMEAASLRTISLARAVAEAPARTIASLAAKLFALGVMALSIREVCRRLLATDEHLWPGQNADPTGQAPRLRVNCGYPPKGEQHVSPAPVVPAGAKRRARTHDHRSVVMGSPLRGDAGSEAHGVTRCQLSPNRLRCTLRAASSRYMPSCNFTP